MTISSIGAPLRQATVNAAAYFLRLHLVNRQQPTTRLDDSTGDWLSHCSDTAASLRCCIRPLICNPLISHRYWDTAS